MPKGNIQGHTPRHVAIIMDGNGRWAKQRGQLRAIGHRAGLKAVRNAVKFASQKQITALTLYAFSSENWNRPEKEVDALMSLFIYALNHEVKKLHKNNIQLRIVGDISRFSAQLQNMIESAQKLTASNTGLKLNIAANYGGRWDIVNAAKCLIEDVQGQKLSADQVDENSFKQYLCLNNLPEVDLVIRTGGEYRVSNFLLWQIAYAELYFTEVLWPDFDEMVFQSAINEFMERERRFGEVNTDNDS